MRAGETAVLLDCGTGVFGRLQTVIDPLQVTAVVITHTHWDHICDLMPYYYRLKWSQDADREPVALWLPPGGAARLNEIGRITQQNGRMTEEFTAREYAPGQQAAIGALSIVFQAVTHYVSAFSVRLELGGRSLVYTGDTGPDPALAPLAQGADLFLCEAVSQGSEKPEGLWGHLSAREAGRVAAAAGVGRLLLTHLLPDVDPAVSVREAAEEFNGPVAWTEERRIYSV
ncbi:MAG: MBL fold metallo-hydrolase [Thermaerobacterales bacterium]